MEALPDDPNLLKEKLVASNLENADLHLQLYGANETIHQLRRDKQTLMGQVKIWKDAAEGALGYDQAVEQLAESNATIVGAEFDILAARSIRGTVRQLTLSLNQHRQTTAMQLRAFLDAKLGEFRALGRVRDLEGTLQTVIEQKDEAVALADSTASLRNLYEEGVQRAARDSEQARQDTKRAIDSEAAAWERAEQLSGVETRNQQLEEENETLRVSEVGAKERAVGLEQELETIRELLRGKEEELKQLSHGRSESSAEINRLRGVEEEKGRLASEVARLRRENRRLHTALGGMLVERGRARVGLASVVLGVALKSIPFFGSRIAEEISRQTFERRR